MAYSDAEIVQRVQATVATSLARTGLERTRRGVVVAVSGGADSLCLLDALMAVTPRAARRLIVGHVDHQLRPESAADAAHVQAAAAAYGLPSSLLVVDVPALAARERRGLEDAARVGRYRALRKLAVEHRGAVVATGHTRNDSNETVLMHLLRGSGRRGLCGVAERESLTAASLGLDEGDDGVSLNLIRPLLALDRADTVAYCEARGIRWRTDETNADPRMLRNRVRAHLLPVLRTYNPAIERALARTAAAMADDEAWIDQQVTRVWRRLARPDGLATIIDQAAWMRQPVALRRRLVRRIAEQAGDLEIGFDGVERALAVGTENGPPRAELGAGLIVERRHHSLRFTICGGADDDRA